MVTKMISHPELGTLEYLKVYLQIEEPELFVCKFSNSEDKYIGRRVEEYTHPITPKTLVHNIYFVGVNDSEITKSESDNKFFNQLFTHRPVLFLHYLRGIGEPICKWRNESRINPMYELTE